MMASTTAAASYGASVTTKALTYSQRSSAAAAHAAARLQVSDDKRVLAALAEIALEELNSNPHFEARVRSAYDNLEVKKASKSSASKVQPPKLVPIKTLPSRELDATRRLDPWFILEYYGESQLESALRRQTTSNLQEAVTVVEERFPGTAPKGKLTKDRAITYILEHTLKN